MPDPVDRPSLFELLRQWLTSTPEQNQPTSQAVADELNRLLPNELSARPGIEEDRRRKAAMDEMLREANR